MLQITFVFVFTLYALTTLKSGGSGINTHLILLSQNLTSSIIFYPRNSVRITLRLFSCENKAKRVVTVTTATEVAEAEHPSIRRMVAEAPA